MLYYATSVNRIFIRSRQGDSLRILHEKGLVLVHKGYFTDDCTDYFTDYCTVSKTMVPGHHTQSGFLLALCYDAVCHCFDTVLGLVSSIDPNANTSYT